MYLFFELAEVLFEARVEVLCRANVELVLPRVMHFDNKFSAVVKCHVQHFLILVLIEELLILVNDRSMCLVERHGTSKRIELTANWTSLVFLISTIRHLEAVLHEAREDLCQLNLGSFLRFITGQLLRDHFIIKRFVKKHEHLLLVELGKILQS